MEFASFILPLTKNICRTCLTETKMLLNIQDLIEHDMIKIKLIDILVFLNCLENNDEENWPSGMCESCVSTALLSYSFKLNCLKTNATLSQIFIQTSSSDLHRSDIDSIDVNVVYQDHEYDAPLFSSQPALDFDTSMTNLSDKEDIPLLPNTEMTSNEQLPRKEGEKRYTCTLCSKSFTRIHGLRYHMAKHDGVRKYLCSKCGKCFHNAGGLRQHSTVHKETGQFKCKSCHKAYKSRQSLKEHIRLAHSNNRCCFVCVTCGKSFTAKSTLMMHNKAHTGNNKFCCPHCPKIYTRASYLKAHSIVHTGQERPRPFLCDKKGCDRSFLTKYSLRVHIAHTHSLDRPHKCNICHKGFATVSGLKIHRESHSSREINCNICGKSLANKRVLQKHIKLHDVDPSDTILEGVVDDMFYDEAMIYEA